MAFGNESKKHGILWWILVIAFFPVSLSIIFCKTDKIKLKKSIRIIIVAAVWVLLLIIGSITPDKTEEPKVSDSSDVSVVMPADSSADSSSDNTESKQEKETSSEEETPQQSVEIQPSQQPAESTAQPEAVTPPPAPQNTDQQITVYITETGDKYHSGGCRMLNKSKIPISLDEARQSHSPCGICHPPS